MTKIFSLTALVLMSFSAIAQITAIEPIPLHSNRLAFKVYNLTTIRPTVKTGGLQFSHEFREQDFLQPTVALSIKNKRNNYHEIELSEFSIRKLDNVFVQYAPYNFPVTISGTQLITTSLAARYEYVRPLLKNKNAAFVPAIGLAGSLFYERFKTNPYTTNIFPTTETTTGMRGFVVPRLNWYVGKRLFFDVNMPVCILQGGYQHSNQMNPLLPIEQQRMGLVQFELLPKYYSFRIGAGWKI